MSTIPDWQQAQESGYFDWHCIICHDLAKSPMHLEDQFLVHNGVYTDLLLTTPQLSLIVTPGLSGS